MKAQQESLHKLVRECVGREAVCTQLLRAVTPLNEGPTRVEEIIPLWLRRVCAATRWPVGHASILAQNDVSGKPLPANIWNVGSAERREEFYEAIDGNKLRLPRSWEFKLVKTARPRVFADLSQQPESSGKQTARDLGLKSAVGMFLAVGNKLKAICEFFSSEPLKQDVLWEQVMVNVGEALAQAIENAALEKSLREMRGKLFNLQDEERRRLARELHDTTGQNMSLIVINTEMLSREAHGLTLAERDRLAECAELARRSLQEIRTFSYVLHPPLLDELGIFAALRLFVEGFSQRSGIAVDLELPERSVPMAREQEVTIFRVIQESLSNVHKHSESATARVRVAFEEGQVEVTVEDEGTGISLSGPRGTLPAKIGVGIIGMQERVKQCGGRLRLNPRAKGTQLQVNLPLPEVARVVAAR